MPGHVIIDNWVSDTCISVSWSIQGLPNRHSATDYTGCFNGIQTGGWNTAWNNNEGNPIPPGQWVATVTIRNRAGQVASASITITGG